VVTELPKEDGRKNVFRDHWKDALHVTICQREKEKKGFFRTAQASIKAGENVGSKRREGFGGTCEEKGETDLVERKKRRLHRWVKRGNGTDSKKSKRGKPGDTILGWNSGGE